MLINANEALVMGVVALVMAVVGGFGLLAWAICWAGFVVRQSSGRSFVTTPGITHLAIILRVGGLMLLSVSALIALVAVARVM